MAEKGKKSNRMVGQGFVRPGTGNCPKCGGFVAQRADCYGAYLSCVNCGWDKDLAVQRRVRWSIAPETTGKAA